jgi:hypothetical protein
LTHSHAVESLLLFTGLLIRYVDSIFLSPRQNEKEKKSIVTRKKVDLGAEIVEYGL